MMYKELKKAIIDWLMENEDKWQRVNDCVEAFREYIYDKKGNYLIGGETENIDMEKVIISANCVNLIKKDDEYMISLITPRNDYRYDYPKRYKYFGSARRYFYKILGNVRGISNYMEVI